MTTTLLRPVTFAGKGDISWGPPHVCGIGSAANLLATPVTGWLSVGLGAVSAGASIYNAFQLHRQKKILDGISSSLTGMRQEVRNVSAQIGDVSGKLDHVAYSLNALHYKVDYLTVNVQKLTELVQAVKTDTQEIKAVQSIHVYLEPALKHFEIVASRESLTHNRLLGLEDDIEQGLRNVIIGNKNNDIPLPNYMIDKAEEIFCFFRVFNLFLVESHNFLVGYDPMEIRSYMPIDQAYYGWGTKPEEQEHALASWENLRTTREKYLKADKKEHKRLQWLYALLWEIKQANHHLSTSETLRKEGNVIYLPVFPEMEKDIVEDPALRVGS